MQKRPSRPRPCTYCPAPGADACVRTQGDGETHIYAHQACAQAKGVDTLYVFTDEQPAGGSS
ncbi:hypothetical protein ACFW96_09010 [Streptomyces gardneri]|uniref:hypothetical protein n=1 Tax=Streptomyces gardneri TaxID=66892 RepID=UPI0036951E4A